MNLPNPLKLVKLEKLRIEVYKNDKRTGIPETLKVMFNPESYSLAYKAKYSPWQALGSSSRSATFGMNQPAELSLKLILDGTGVSENLIFSLLPKKDVEKEVQEFLKATFRIDGDIHQPKYLKVSWGKDLDFDCRVSDVTVNYTLFDNGGNPLRAELDVVFVGDESAGTRAKKNRLSSPDLTHKRVVKDQDTLPLLCEAIYGTPDYYLQVARANNLTNFRNLQPGQELYFPPVKS